MDLRPCIEARGRQGTGGLPIEWGSALLSALKRDDEFAEGGTGHSTCAAWGLVASHPNRW